jgi:hypothetical protein
LVGAAFAFIGEMFAGRDSVRSNTGEAMDGLSGAFREKLSECMEKTADGKLKMTITLPDETFLDNMARSLAQMVALGTDVRG